MVEDLILHFNKITRIIRWNDLVIFHVAYPKISHGFLVKGPYFPWQKKPPPLGAWRLLKMSSRNGTRPPRPKACSVRPLRKMSQLESLAPPKKRGESGDGFWDLWWFMMISDDLWWFTMIWEFMMIWDHLRFKTMNCDKTQVVEDSSWFTTMNCDTVKPRSLKIHHDLRRWIVIKPRSLMIYHDLRQWLVIQ